MGYPPLSPPREVEERGGVTLILRALCPILGDEGETVIRAAETYRHTVGTSLLPYERRGIRIVDRHVTSHGIFVRAHIFYKNANAALV